MRIAGPIGVFDSGVGGLAVLREIRSELPEEDLLYAADSGYAPYGEQSREFIETRSIAIVEFLVGAGSKAVVVACNTATSIAIQVLRSRFSIPIVGMEPAVKPAASKTRSGVIGVIATSQTLSSPQFARLIARYGADVEILLQPCPELVEQVEKGELSGPKTRSLVEKYIRPLLAKGADTVVLGCTHYQFLSPVIQEVCGPNVLIVDPAVAVAREVRRRLERNNLLSFTGHQGTEQFWTSGPSETVRSVVSRLWMKDVPVHPLPPLVSRRPR